MTARERVTFATLLFTVAFLVFLSWLSRH